VIKYVVLCVVSVLFPVFHAFRVSRVVTALKVAVAALKIVNVFHVLVSDHAFQLVKDAEIVLNVVIAVKAVPTV